VRYFAIFLVIIAAVVYWIGVGVTDRSQLAQLSRKSIPLAIVGGYLPADDVIEQPQWGSVLGRDASVWKTPACGFFRNGKFVFEFTPSAAIGQAGNYTVSCSADSTLSDTEPAPLDFRRGG
jgi:hypothetical protein